MSAPAAPASAGEGRGRRSGRPVVRALRRLPGWLWACLVVGALLLAVALVAVANPGHRVGPVRPADPPVGGQALPDTRLF